MGQSWTDPLTRWRSAVHYRHQCEGGCGETTDCAVIKRRGKRALRICKTCYADGFWRTMP